MATRLILTSCILEVVRCGIAGWPVPNRHAWRPELNFARMNDMARLERRLAINVKGDFYVDDSCIDCDACRQIAPSTFRDHGGQSSVYRQPESAPDLRRALMALVACPTASIGTRSRLSAREAVQAGVSRANHVQRVILRVYGRIEFWRLVVPHRAQRL